MSLQNELLSLDPDYQGGEETNVVAEDGSTVSFSDAAAEEIVHQGIGGAAEMIEHAEKAEEIADGLNNLADKAEELVAEDHAHVHSAVSAECLHREFSAIMRMGGLSYKATSFEAAGDSLQRLAAIGQDARRIALQARTHANGILDYSTEGSLMNTLRADGLRLNSAVKSLQADYGRLAMVKNKLTKPLVISQVVLYRVMQRQNQPKAEIRKEVDADINWVKNVVGLLQNHYNAVISAANGNGAIPKLSTDKLITRPGELLGNRSVTAELKYKNDSKVNIFAAGSGVSKGVALGVLLTAAGLSGPAAVAFGAVAAADSYRQSHNRGQPWSMVCTVEDLLAVSKDLIDLRSIAAKLDNFDKGHGEDVAKKLTETNAEAARELKEELKKIVKGVEVAYEHARFLILSFSSIVGSATTAIEKGYDTDPVSVAEV